MKYKNPIHPKLYLSVLQEGRTFYLNYKYNVFNDQGNRIILNEIIDASSFNTLSCLVEKNLKQIDILKKYIKIQKMVLHKHQKSRNYDACKIVKSSINEMLSFEKEFKDWFLDNNYEL
tara:strand:- start:161 stop:514 length:354 start_codon:yes stop_codon:yes gene_type:complete